LAALYPGRIDLGLGRASAGRSDNEALVSALHSSPEARERYPSDAIELQSYFQARHENQEVIAMPGIGVNMPIWLLGSSDFSAKQAGVLGMPFVFATLLAASDADAWYWTERDRAPAPLTFASITQLGVKRALRAPPDGQRRADR
jgi:alkanesulfonate monooxygenase SsuD/methylene tetrahydromethanopterin reductase-like flavin-dependent oxidoreductase (luciferase family)